jgi:hypothetical protein
MKPITREELDHWKQLAEAATAGPWEVVEYEAGVFIMFSDGFDSSSMGTGDARFIAAARDAVPRLVAEVERLTGARVPELLRQISEQREEILTAFVAKYGCGPDECEQVVQRSPDGEKYWVRLRAKQVPQYQDRPDTNPA